MTRKPSNKTLVPPTLDEDAAERKRVLNVLAQRRYRRKKKERIQALESRVKPPTVTPLSAESSPNPGDTASTVALETNDNPQDSVLIDGSTSSLHSVSLGDHINGDEDSILFSLPSLDTPALALDQAGFDYPDTGAIQALEESDLDPFWASLNIQNSPFDLQLQPPSSSCDQLAISDKHGISEELQAYDTTFFTFPDDHTLEVPSLSLLNASMRVAQQLKISERIWDVTAISPFFQTSSLSSNGSEISLSPPSLDSISSTAGSSPANSSLLLDLTELPPHLQPTKTQRLIAHHPLFDLLPWPAVRDKLIQIFNLPIHMRPASAQDPMGFVRFVYDMEDDSGEGIRITGQDPFDPDTWEIGQLLFERWLWAFDMGVIESSNRSRKRRGKAQLVIKS